MKYLLYLVLFILFGLVLSTKASRSSFGEACNKEKRCDSKALLTCSQEICQCLMPNTMVFDDIAKKCVALAGERCVYTAVEGDRTWTDAVPCVSNAICTNGVCTCNPEYFEIANGTCEAKRDFGEACINGSIEMCITGQVCGDLGHCECEPSRVYDVTQKNCLILPGEKCKSGQNDKCVRNANCENEVCSCLSAYFKSSDGTCQEKKSYGLPCSTNDMCKSDQKLTCGGDGYCKCVPGRVFSTSQGYCLIGAEGDCNKQSSSREILCTENSECSSYYNGKCVCNNGYFKNLDNSCIEIQDYGGPCIVNSNCKQTLTYQILTYQRYSRSYEKEGKEASTFLECINGSCNCQRGSVYNSSNSFPCSRFVGYSCDSDYNQNQCVAQAYCDSSNRRCECSSDFYENDEKTCSSKKGFGQTCKEDKECRSKSLHLSCNSDKTCSCNSETALHPVSKMCVKRPGESCDNNYRSYLHNQVPNVICKNDRFVCNDNSTRTSDGHCYISEDRPCDSDFFGNFGNNTQTCLPGLHCINDICSCFHKNHQIYNATEDKCFSLIKGPCKKSEDCVQNSDCVDMDGIKQCKCKTGFTPVERRCDLAYGQQCHQGQLPPKCDRLAPLGCSAQGLCDCLDFQVYNNSTLTCRGLVGAKCDIVKKNFCVDGAICTAFRSKSDRQGVCVCQPGTKSDTDRTCKAQATLNIEEKI